MIPLLLAAGLVVALLVVGLFVQRRDRRRGHHTRDPGEMWRDTIREQARDIRAVKAVHNVYNPDLSHTDWGRRNRPDR